MSVVKLLLVKSGSGVGEFETLGLAACGIELHTCKADQLSQLTASDLEIALFDDRENYDSLEAIRQVSRLAPACKLIVRLESAGTRAVDFLQAGVTGVLDSFHQAEPLAEIIRRLGRGDYYLDQETGQLLAMRRIKKLLEPFAALSSREFDVFCLLAEERTLQTIAEQLGISSKTVSNCQTAIKIKLGLDSKQALKEFAKSHGLVIEKRV